MILWVLYIDIIADPRRGMDRCCFKTCRWFCYRSDHYYHGTAPKVKVSKWKCLFAEITDASVVSGFTENELESVHIKNMSWFCNSLLHWKARQIRYVSTSPVPLIFPRLSRAKGNASVPVLVVLQVILRLFGRVFKLSVVRVYFFDFISLLFLALPWLQTKITLLYAIGAAFLSVLSFAWFYLTSGSSVSTKYTDKEECSSSLDLLPSTIRRMANTLLAFSSLPFFPRYLLAWS